MSSDAFQMTFAEDADTEIAARSVTGDGGSLSGFVLSPQPGRNPAAMQRMVRTMMRMKISPSLTAGNAGPSETTAAGTEEEPGPFRNVRIGGISGEGPCLAVWKATSESAPFSGDYAISMSDVSAVPGERGEPRPPARLETVQLNPFRGQVHISYAVETGLDVTLDICGVRGQIVRRLVDAVRPPGRYEVAWNGRDDAGRLLAGGLYWVRFRAGRFRDSRKILLTR